jgi:hypothetical protein
LAHQYITTISLSYAILVGSGILQRLTLYLQYWPILEQIKKLEMNRDIPWISIN